MKDEYTKYLDNLVTKYGSRVFSMRNKKPDSNHIYIGRGKGSILGNPFFTSDNKTLEDRVSNCIKYRTWISNIVVTNSNPSLIKQIKALNNKNVICWCSNGSCSTAEGAQYCHGHILLSLADYLNKDTETQNPLDNYTNYSGGAYGGDTVFHLIGIRHGFNNHIHYRPKGNPNCSKPLKDLGVKPLLLEEAELEYASNQIYNLIGIRYKPGSFGADLQLRNYYQIQDSEAVFAVAYIQFNRASVSGGTNTAVQMAIAKGIPVYVLDVDTVLWHIYNSSKGFFEPCSSIPVLTKHWTGIGTRDIQTYKRQVKGEWMNTEWCGPDKYKLVEAQINNLFLETLKSL